jgi:hypothetical protein
MPILKSAAADEGAAALISEIAQLRMTSLRGETIYQSDHRLSAQARSNQLEN